MSGVKMPVEIKNRLEIIGADGMELQLFTAGSISNDFLKSNKKITTDYRTKYAQAVGTTGQIARIVKMAFGTAGETDSQGNPAPPIENGPLQNSVLIKDIKSITYPVPTTVCFEAEILAADGITAAINEIALIDEDNNTAAKIRLLTSKGVDAESGLIFRWYMEF